MPKQPAKVPDTGPVRRPGPQRPKGNPTKDGKIFGNPYKRKGGK